METPGRPGPVPACCSRLGGGGGAAVRGVSVAYRAGVTVVRPPGGQATGSARERVAGADSFPLTRALARADAPYALRLRLTLSRRSCGLPHA